MPQKTSRICLTKEYQQDKLARWSQIANFHLYFDTRNRRFLKNVEVMDVAQPSLIEKDWEKKCTRELFRVWKQPLASALTTEAPIDGWHLWRADPEVWAHQNGNKRHRSRRRRRSPAQATQPISGDISHQWRTIGRLSGRVQGCQRRLHATNPPSFSLDQKKNRPAFIFRWKITFISIFFVGCLIPWQTGGHFDPDLTATVNKKKRAAVGGAVWGRDSNRVDLCVWLSARSEASAAAAQSLLTSEATSHAPNLFFNALRDVAAKKFLLAVPVGRDVRAAAEVWEQHETSAVPRRRRVTLQILCYTDFFLVSGVCLSISFSKNFSLPTLNTNIWTFYCEKICTLPLCLKESKRQRFCSRWLNQCLFVHEVELFQQWYCVVKSKSDWYLRGRSF